MTHTTKHTPGPWVAHHSGIGDATVVAECGWVNKDGTPFNPTIISRIDWPTAHLIAAAPAMYEALQATLAYFMRSNQSHAPEVRVIRAALAQAEGR